VDVARLFGLKPRSLGAYVKRNQLAAPTPDGPNRALYSKQAVIDFWKLRERRSPQYYQMNDLPAPLRSEAVTAAIAALAGKEGTDLVVSPDEVRQMLQAGISEGITSALAPLVTEIVALREEVAGLRQELREAHEAEGPTKLPTKWQQFFGFR
jgi:hypothetical protein